MLFKFNPSEEIRNIDLKRDMIGKTVTINLLHSNKDKTDQFAAVEPFSSPILFISGWTGKFFDEKESKIIRKIIDAYFIEHINGGRTNSITATSYKDFFNDERKKYVQRFWQGLLGKLMSRRGGDADQADLIIVFEDCKIDSFCYDVKAPEEWYSEMFRDNPRFSFPKGFYSDAEEAIHFFSDRPVDDMFGERYFPVIVFPIETLYKIEDLVCYAKAYSKPIVTDKYIIFGTRCISGEYQTLIQKTYENNGKIAKSQNWDWDS